MVPADPVWIVAVGRCVRPRHRDKDTFVDTCEEVIRERLKAPSTYRRIGAPEVIHHSETLSDSDFSELIAGKEQILQEIMQESRSEGTGWLQVSYFETTIEYDAANAFGVPIRRVSRCRSGSWYNHEKPRYDLSRSLVEVDGQTQTDWALERASDALRQYEQYRRQRGRVR